MRTFATILLALASVALARPARAQGDDLSWSLTETFVLEWHGETDGFEPTATAAHDRDNYLALKNRANLGLHRGPLDVQLRLDQSTFWATCPTMPSDPTEIDAADLQGCRSPREGVLEDDYRLERATASLRLGRHTLWVGDFPLQVGRGIALSLRKVSEFGIDDALRGSRLQLRLHDAVRLDLFGGLVNVSNLDEVTDTHVDEVRDRLAGGRIEGRILDVATVGAHGIFLVPRGADGVSDTDFLGGLWTFIAGGTLEMPDLFDRLSFYAEADGLVRYLDDGRGEDEGWALYSSVDLDLGPVTLLGELKWYENFVVAGSVVDGRGLSRPLSQPPTIERQDQFVRSLTDVLGGRLRVDVRLPMDFLLFANFAYVAGRRSNSFDSMHGYGGLEYRLGDGRVSGTVTGGYRREFARDDEGPHVDHLDFDIVDVQANATIGLVGRHGLHVTLIHETWNKPAAGSDDPLYFNRGTIALGYDYGSLLSINVAYEYDTQFAWNTYRYIDEEGVWQVQNGIRQHFGFAEVRYSPFPWLDLRLRGGAMRGGLRCVAGVCRVFPNFTGARIEGVFRF